MRRQRRFQNSFCGRERSDDSRLLSELRASAGICRNDRLARTLALPCPAVFNTAPQAGKMIPRTHGLTNCSEGFSSGQAATVSWAKQAENHPKPRCYFPMRRQARCKTVLSNRQENTAFPLTPALSHRERENRTVREDGSRAYGLFWRSLEMFPLLGARVRVRGMVALTSAVGKKLSRTHFSAHSGKRCKEED